MLTKKQQRILKLAEAGGTDKELAILDAINEMEDDFQKQVDDLKKTINSRLLDALLVKSANHPDYEKIVSRIKGDKGDKGDSIYGPMGPQGPQGEKGDKGDKGDVGPQGESIVGPKGDKGEKGEKGIDGSPDTAEQVRDKLETLQGDNRLDKSSIKGLDEALNNIQKTGNLGGMVRVGGGGQYAWVHQLFNVSSATTTVTLSNPIGAAGLAIFAAYNGANIVRGTHYTVDSSGKILTLLFTPEDGTSIDVAYMIAKKVI